jgi:hypothetical protein
LCQSQALIDSDRFFDRHDQFDRVKAISKPTGFWVFRHLPPLSVRQR